MAGFGSPILLRGSYTTDFPGVDITGATDSSSGIQAAVTATAGSVLYWTPGTYLIGSIVTAQQKSSHKAAPGTVTVRQKTNSNLPAVFQSANCTSGLLTSFTEWTNFEMDGFVFDGNGTNQSGYTTSTPQCFSVFFGSNIRIKNSRFINCGASVASNLQIPTGLLVGCSVENPANGARIQCPGLVFENCYGVASWITNAKGGFSNSPGPDSYGQIGNSDVSYQKFVFCKHGLYIEDRCNGVTANGIQYYGDPANLSTAGIAVSILYSSNIQGSVYAQYASAALIASGSPAEPSDNIIFDAFADSCSSGGVKLTGGTAIASTVTTTTATNSSTLPLTVTAGTIAGNTWLLIQDGGASEWVQVASFTGGVATLISNTTHAHNSGVSVISDSGMRHFTGRIVSRNNGSLADATGLFLQTVYDSVITITAYDTRQYLSAPGTATSGVTQFQGVTIGSKCKRVQLYGNLYGNRDWAINDDGTNSECYFNGIVGQTYDNTTHQTASADMLTYDTTYPSQWRGTGAPSNNMGKNGDFYRRADGGSLTTIYQRRSGSWVGIV